MIFTCLGQYYSGIVGRSILAPRVSGVNGGYIKIESNLGLLVNVYLGR